MATPAHDTYAYIGYTTDTNTSSINTLAYTHKDVYTSTIL